MITQLIKEAVDLVLFVVGLFGFDLALFFGRLDDILHTALTLFPTVSTYLGYVYYFIPKQYLLPLITVVILGILLRIILAFYHAVFEIT